MSSGLNLPTYVAINHAFSGVRVMREYMTPATWHIKLYCAPAITSKGPIQKDLDAAAISYQVVTYWLQNILQHPIIIDPTTSFGLFLYEVSENRLVFTPSAPDDNILARLLHQKIRTLSKGNLEIGSIVLTSSDTGNTERHFVGGEYMLPGIDYIGEEVLHSEPWWMRATADTSEIIKSLVPEEEIEELKTIQDPIEEYERLLYEETEILGEGEEAEIIEVNVWKKT